MIEVSHLVVNGCSFAYCQGLENPSTQGWPALLAKKLNVPIVNISCKGSGNDSIMRRTVEYYYKDDKANKPFYIVTLSQSTRREEYVINYENKIIKNFHQLASFSSEPIEKAIYEQYDIDGIKAQEERKLLYWVSVINMFKANKINYLMADFMPEHNQEIIEHTKFLNSTLYNTLHMDEFFIDNLNSLTKNLPKLPCGHDGYETQEFIADMFYKNMNDKYGQVNPVSLNFLKAKDFLPLHASSDYNRMGSDWCTNL